MKKKKKICKTALVISIALLLVICLFNPDAQFFILNIISGILGAVAFISIIGWIICKIWE